MTQEILNRLPEKVIKTMKMWNERYHSDRLDKDITRAEIRGYIRGLRDAELLKSDIEYRAIFCYMTL